MDAVTKNLLDRVSLSMTPLSDLIGMKYEIRFEGWRIAGSIADVVASAAAGGDHLYITNSSKTHTISYCQGDLRFTCDIPYDQRYACLPIDDLVIR